MRVVLDTNVVVSAMRSPSGASAEILRLARKRVVVPIVTVALTLEYEAVCLRPEQIAATGVSGDEARNFIDAVVRISEPVDVHFRWRPLLRDAADEMVLEAAINGAASAITTFNLKDFVPFASRFGVDVCTPRDFLRRMT